MPYVFTFAGSVAYDEYLIRSRLPGFASINYVNDFATSDSIGVNANLELVGLTGNYPQENTGFDDGMGLMHVYSHLGASDVWHNYTSDGIDFQSELCVFDVISDFSANNFYAFNDGATFYLQNNRVADGEIDRYSSSDGVNFVLIETVPLVDGVNYQGIPQSAIIPNGAIPDCICGFCIRDGVNSFIVTTSDGVTWERDPRYVFPEIEITDYFVFYVPETPTLIYFGLDTSNVLYSVNLTTFEVLLLSGNVFDVISTYSYPMAFSGNLYAVQSTDDFSLNFYLGAESTIENGGQSGNQSITGGGINGQGGAVGFSGVSASNSSGISLTSLAYPAGIVPHGVNDFGIDLGL